MTSGKNYDYNTRDWQIGQYVIHYSDAKRDDMLMRVISVNRAGGYYQDEFLLEDEYITEYVHDSHIVSIGKKYVKRKVFRNSKEFLLDPNDFGMSVPYIVSTVAKS